MNAEIRIGDIVAALALILSAYATWRTQRFQKQEAELLELQREVNALVLEKERRDAEQVHRADLGANFVSVGSSNYRLRVFNRGRAVAHNVRLRFPEGNDLILQDDIDEKLPLESMEPGQSFDLIALRHMQSKSKLAVLLQWEDADGQSRDKLIYPTM